MILTIVMSKNDTLDALIPIPGWSAAYDSVVMVSN